MDKMNDYLGNLNQEIYRKQQEISHENDLAKQLEVLIVEATKESNAHQEKYQNLGVILGMTASEYDKSLKMKQSVENEISEMEGELNEISEVIENKMQLKNKMDAHYKRMEEKFLDLTKHKTERRNELLNSLQRDTSDNLKLFKSTPVRSKLTAIPNNASKSAIATPAPDATATAEDTAKLAMQQLKGLGLFSFNYGCEIQSEKVPVPDLINTDDKENSAQVVDMDYIEEKQVNNSSKLIDDISMAETQKTDDVDFFSSKKTSAPEVKSVMPMAIHQDINRMENASSVLLENKQSSESDVSEGNNKGNSALQNQMLHQGHQGHQKQPPTTTPIEQQKKEEIVDDVEDFNFKIPNDPDNGKYGTGFFDVSGPMFQPGPGFNFFNTSTDTDDSSSGDNDIGFFKWTGASTSDAGNTSISSGNSDFLFF